MNSGAADRREGTGARNAPPAVRCSDWLNEAAIAAEKNHQFLYTFRNRPISSDYNTKGVYHGPERSQTIRQTVSAPLANAQAPGQERKNPGCIRKSHPAVAGSFRLLPGQTHSQTVGILFRPTGGNPFLEHGESRLLGVHIRRGKGHKDRFVPLPDLTLQGLRELWRKHRHPQLLFPNANGPLHKIKYAKNHMDRGGAQKAMKVVVQECGIKKSLHPYASPQLCHPSSGTWPEPAPYPAPFGPCQLEHYRWISCCRCATS
nr:hypothetical protein [uncultured bacterium]